MDRPDSSLQQFGADLGAQALHRFVAMLAHCHGRILNVAELSTALNVAQATVRRYLDLLEHLFLVRLLRPWHERITALPAAMSFPASDAAAPAAYPALPEAGGAG